MCGAAGRCQSEQSEELLKCETLIEGTTSSSSAAPLCLIRVARFLLETWSPHRNLPAEASFVLCAGPCPCP